MAKGVDSELTAPAVCSGTSPVASILNLSVMLGNYLQQTTSADDIFICIFFLGAIRVNTIVFRVTLSYGKCSKNSNTSLFLFSNKKLVKWTGIHQILI